MIEISIGFIVEIFGTIMRLVCLGVGLAGIIFGMKLKDWGLVAMGLVTLVFMLFVIAVQFGVVRLVV